MTFKRTTHPEYDKNQENWLRLHLMDRNEVKDDPTLFLPTFECGADSDRYKKYVQRALYVNYTGWTKGGLSGMVFRIPGVVEVPENLSNVIESATKDGKSFEHMQIRTINNMLLFGRHGILADYDSKQDKAYFAHYDALSTPDWDEEEKLNWVKLSEVHKEHEGGNAEYKNYTRLLALDEDGFYYQSLYNEDDELVLIKDVKGNSVEAIYPTDYNGNKLDFIPFQFFGSEDNDASVDKSPLLDISNVCVSHFQNSAELEDSLKYLARPTVFFTSDLSEEQFAKANPNGFQVGGPAANNLGQNGSAMLLQMQEGTEIVNTMKRKEEQMVHIGARFISPQAQNETAETARIRASQSTSGLTVLVMNADDGFTNLLQWAALFEDANPDEVFVGMNKDFYDMTMSAQDIMALITLRQERTIAQSDVRAKLRKTDYIAQDRTDLEIDEELANEM
jgi:hypothetical protein